MILRDIFRHLAASLILLAAVVAIAITRADVDLWGHVLFGLDSLRDLRLEAADPYSFTSDRPWVNHEWLSEVILALAWRSGGSAGLVAVKLACALGALTLVSCVPACAGGWHCRIRYRSSGLPSRECCHASTTSAPSSFRCFSMPVCCSPSRRVSRGVARRSCGASRS